MSFASACASMEAISRELQAQETFGHLAPRKNIKYHGRFVYAIGCYCGNERTVLFNEFKSHRGIELNESPWYYERLHEFIDDHDTPGEPGEVYEFEGSFCNYEFSGTFRKVYSVEPDKTRPVAKLRRIAKDSGQSLRHSG